jgi:hypothetical protein
MCFSNTELWRMRFMGAFFFVVIVFIFRVLLAYNKILDEVYMCILTETKTDNIEKWKDYRKIDI